MRTASRRYRLVVLVVTLLTVAWMAVPAAAVVNTPPVAAADSYTVAEDGVLTVAAPGVLANDTDADGDPLAVAALIGAVGNGTLTAYRDGSFTYVPDPDFHGTDSWGYQATDGTDISNAVRVTVTVTPVNDPPVAQPDAYSMSEDQLMLTVAPGVLANDADVEGDPLTAVLDVAPANAAVFALNADGSFKYEPDPDYNGIDSFGYHANDGTDDSATVRVTITVRPINDRPVGVPDSYAVDEDTTLVVAAPGILGNDWDVDGDALTAVLRVGPTHAAAFALNADGSFKYEPDPNYHGPDSFGYRATDGMLSSRVARVTIDVRSVNDVPVGLPDIYRVLEDGVLTIAAPGILGNDTDADGDTLKAVVDTGPANGTLAAFGGDGSFTYEPDPNFNGTDHFGYHATDGTDDSAVTRVTIIVIPVNDAPVAVADEYRVIQDGELTVAAPGVLGNDTDADGDTLKAVLDTGPAHGTLNVLRADGSFKYTPDPRYAGPDRFRYHAADGSADSNIVTVRINVLHLCDGHVATIVGTNGPNVINGTAGDDVIVGLGGRDEIHGLGGNDIICGGSGLDTIWGGDGDDRIFAGGGNDVVYGEAGNDRIEGYAGHDRLFGGDGADVLRGEGGNDVLKGQGDRDILHGGKGFDRMFGNRDRDLLRARDGAQDRLNGGRGSDRAVIDPALDLLTSIETIL